ncbi:MAG: hypothetical protein H7Y16_09200 [Candidatus Parcubacteria bacterium]|nr:hypothetical protein [Burkholderiales bacterium]
MLHELLTSNRIELIKRCRAKAASRFLPTDPKQPPGVDHGVPMFLQQLIDTLSREQFLASRVVATPETSPGNTEIARAAALHGAEMLARGYTVSQVIRDYGDVCQSVTDLAVEQASHIETEEFRTLNRCLDDAIADAVTAYGSAGKNKATGQAENLHRLLDSFADEQGRLVDIAIESFAAIKVGNVGLGGATATLLTHALKELRALAERSLPEIRLAYATPALAAK